MKQANKFLAALLILALTFAMAAPGLLMAEEEKSVAIPDLVDVIPLAAELSGRLAVLEKQIRNWPDLSEVEKDLSGIVANLEDYSAQLQRLKASGAYRYGQLVLLSEALESEGTSLEKVSQPLNKGIQQLGASRKNWLAEKKRWEAWQSSLLKDEPIDEVKLAFGRAQKTIDAALNLILEQLKPQLAMQSKAANVQTRIRSLTAEVDGIILAKRGGVLYDSSPPMFSSRYFAQFGSGLLYAVQKGSDKVSWSWGRFFAQQGWIALLQGLVALVLIIVIFRHRQELEASERWRFVGKRPFSAGFFVGFTILCFFYEGLPVTWSFTQVAVICISFARLVSGLIEASWKRRFVYAVTIFIIITRLLDLVSLPLPLSRLYIFVATLLGLFLSLRWAGASGHRGESFLYRWALRLCSCLFVVVLTLELWGIAGLAEYLLVSSMGTIVTLLIALLLTYLARGGLEWAVYSPPLQRVTFLSNNAAAVIHRAAVFIDVVIGVLVLSNVLRIWRVYASQAEAVEAMLSFGLTLGSLRISVGLVIAAAGLLCGSFLISWIIQRLLLDEVLAKRGVETGVQLSVSRLIHYALILTGFLLALLALGFELTKLTIILSALGVGIGFGLQSVVNNFVCGLILLFERPVRVGDYIELGGRWAEIKRIGLRSTVVRTFDSADIIVPNSNLISNEVTNWTLSDRVVRLIIPVGVAYGSDVPLVTETLTECALANSKVLRMPEPEVLFRDFGESSLDFELRAWISNADERLRVASDLRHDIDRRFREAAIVIAFPQRDLHVHSVDESPSLSLTPPEEKRSDLVVVPRKENDEDDEKNQ